MPTDPAYSRVANADRFIPLHTAILEINGEMENDFEVELMEGNGLDEELEIGRDLARPDVKLNPAGPDAAPFVVAFNAFPDLGVRFGRWYLEPFPSCGCDARDESAEGESERLGEMFDDVTAGRFREAIEIHPIPLGGLVGWRPGSGHLTLVGHPRGLEERLLLKDDGRVRCQKVAIGWT